MPAYDYECRATDCGGTFEVVRPMAESSEPSPCPTCGHPAPRIITFGRTETTFTERLYPFYHDGIGEVVRSEKHLTERCKQLGFASRHEGAHLTKQQEQRMMRRRVHENPRPLREQVRWSGRGAHLPTFEVD